MEILQNRLTDLRLKEGLLQRDVADALHIHRSTYSYYERGKTNPPLDILIKLADYFGVTTDYLLGVDNIASRTKDVVHCGECGYCIHQINSPPEVEWICIESHNYCECGAKIVAPNNFCGYGKRRGGND